MTVTIHIYYTGRNGAAMDFAQETAQSGMVAAARNAPGNLKYEYFFPLDDPETALLIESWEDPTALEDHEKSALAGQIAALGEKYGLSVRVERFREV